MFNKKTILVTGGTGTFGENFTKYILDNFKPRKLIVFSRDEYKQLIMQEKFLKNFQQNILRFFIGDVRDSDRLNMAFKDVDYIVHAAAMKQVPITEKEPLECIKTNIGGAENIIKAALKNNVKKVIALSTDKAVNPINLYGATKLASDKLFISANFFSGKNGTQFSIVRYGNVVGSRGSVIPYFQELIKKNILFLPITDKNMTRFFITIEQGIDFVINSFKRMKGGEVFIPKIPSVFITDVALALRPSSRFKIIGIRPGEKIHEVLFSKEDSYLIREFKDHYVLLSPIYHKNILKNFKNNQNQLGKKLKNYWEYNSLENKFFLKRNQIINLILKTKI
jgi:UDP-N-acetylglucosamine 4,6-dehydratase